MWISLNRLCGETRAASVQEQKAGTAGWQTWGYSGNDTARPGQYNQPSMTLEPPSGSCPSVGQRQGRKIVNALTVAAAMALVAALSVRPLSSPDLGYHLAYGGRLLDTGRIVDHNSFIYTLPVGAAARRAAPPGPGCWYDAEGRYRFVNANWLSQAFMVAAWRAGGPVGLCALQIALVLGIFTAMLVAMRRGGVPWPAAAGAVVLAAVAAQTRFNARPEVFALALLAVQLAILSGRRLSWPGAAALVAVQVVLVNCHSYFLLGPAMTAAMLAGRGIARLPWLGRPAGPAGPARPGSADRPPGDSARLAAALVGQLVACFANPWTWRLAVLPIQTLAFMHANHIAGGNPAAGPGHPWSYIGEFFTPFAGAFAHTKATYAFYGVLALAAAGALCAIVKRRWGRALLIVGMAAMACAMRRNIATGAVLIVPPAMASCWLVLRDRWRARPWQLRAKIERLAAGVVLVIAIWLTVTVIRQGFYFSDRSPSRFGLGLSRLRLPLEAADWIGRHAGDARIWTDYTSSSNIHFFTGGRAVPILTNTWAYPPAVMRKVLAACWDDLAFQRAESEYGFDVVVVRADRSTGAMIGRLAASPRWKLVQLGAMYLVFAKTSSPGRAISRANFDLPGYLAKVRASDPVPAHALHVAGLSLYYLGWLQAAGEAFAAAVAEDPSYYEAWNMEGFCLATAGTAELRRTGRKDKLLAARDCFRRALELKGDYRPAAENLRRVQRRLR